MADTVVLKCSCKHDYQDRKYGEGNRLHNPAQGKNSGKFHCTVCGTKR